MRSNLVSLIVGRRYTGKSTLCKKMALWYAEKTKKRVLIIDVNGAEVYDDLQHLSENQFKTWCNDDANEYSKVACFYLSDEDYMMEIISQNFKNGAVFFEDCTKYIEAKPKKIVKKFLVDCRMWNADLFFTFHSLISVPIFYWTMTNKVFLLRTNDILEKKDNFFIRRIPNYMAIKEGMLKLRKDKAEYPDPIVVDTDI
jgi:hypothetical protein